MKLTLTKQVLSAFALFGAVTTITSAADVATTLGRGAATLGVAVENILTTGATVQSVQGRAGPAISGKATAKFAVSTGARRAAGDALVERFGRG